MNANRGLVLAYSMRGTYETRHKTCIVSFAVFAANVLKRKGESKTVQTFVSNVLSKNVKLSECLLGTPDIDVLLTKEKIIAVRPVKIYCRVEEEKAFCGHSWISLLLRRSKEDSLEWEPKSILCTELCDIETNCKFFLTNYIAEIDKSQRLVTEEDSRIQVSIVDPNLLFHGTTCLWCVRCRRCMLLRREHDDPKKTCKKHKTCLAPNKQCKCGPYVNKLKALPKSRFPLRKTNTSFF